MKSIEKIGTYFAVDEEGYVQNKLIKESIQPAWNEVLELLVVLCKEKFGSNLNSIYVRGSVAKGTAIKNISDVDLLILLKDRHVNLDFEKEQVQVRTQYPFVTGVEFSVYECNSLSQLRGLRRMIKTQSIHIFGEDVEKQIEGFKIGVDMYAHMYEIADDIQKIQMYFAEVRSKEEIEKACTWIMKRLLRTGFELVMTDVKKYTRDLYLCYEAFSKYYPMHEQTMKKVLWLAINPTVDKNVVLKILSSFGNYIVNEAKAKIA